MTEINFEKSYPFNFVPIIKTPWGGRQISILKKRYFTDHHNIPDKIGESLEIRVHNLLLKWIEADEPLSVQIHPNHHSNVLKENECGKHEAWFVYQVINPSPVYLGFKENFSEEEIKSCLKSDSPLECLHSFLPTKNSYITIPPGCVHALGSGTFIAEPQYLLTNKDGKTLRLFDWNRLYNFRGERDEKGKPRELHFEDGLRAIDWSLPRGRRLEKDFIRLLNHADCFPGDHYNPFALQCFFKSGLFTLKKFNNCEFSLITVFSGEVKMTNSHQSSINLKGGESACLPGSLEPYQIEIKKMFNEDPCVLVFALNSQFLEIIT